MARYDAQRDYEMSQDPNARNAPSTIVVCFSCEGWWYEDEFPEHQEGCPCSEDRSYGP
jgi:hypothetical protein